MNILVTGGTGFLGSHLVPRLARDGHTVTVLRRGTSEVRGARDLPVRYVAGDVTNADQVRAAVRGQEVVIHTAAGLSGPSNRARSFEGNVTGARNVADACLTGGVRRLVHVSSVAAIGIARDATPATEEFRFNLEGSRLHYHVSKHRAEHAVLDDCTRGLDAVIVNPGGLWGPFGADYRGGDVVRMVERARTVRYTAGGVCVVHAADVADGIVAAMERGTSGERYILGGDNLGFREWMAAIAAALGVQRKLVAVPRVVTRLVAGAVAPLAAWSPRFYGAYIRARFAGLSTFYDSGKAARTLGYRPRGFDAVAAECVEHLRR